MTALWRLIGLSLAALLVAPLVLIVLFSFSAKPISNFPIPGWSLRWWREMVAFGPFPEALRNSLVIGLAVGVLASIIGTLAALGLARMPPARARLAIGLLSLPLMLPPLLLGVMLLVWYLFLGFDLGLPTVIASHLLFALPFVVIVVYARLSSFDVRIVESARDLGASPLRAFLSVTLPVIQPVVIGAALIATALSIDDFVITSFTIGGGNTLPLVVMSSLRTSVTPMTNAIGTTLIGTSIAATLGALYLTRYRG